MKEPELHYATDRRCFNGAFSSDMERQFKSQNDVLTAIKQKYPDFSVTYFPMEGKYLTFLKYNPVTNVMHYDKGQCLLEAWRVLIAKTQPHVWPYEVNQNEPTS